MLYLAYGSNINKEQMKERCKDALFVTSGLLDDYTLVFDGYSNSRGGLVADIRKELGKKVPYVLWLINEKDLRMLDCAEGYKKDRPNTQHSYYRTTLNIPEFGDVYVYLMTPTFISKRQENHIIPSEYISIIKDGYRYFRLDISYLEKAINDVKN